MRKVKFKRCVDNRYESDFTHVGLFHKWGSNYEEYENDIGNYTIALVELLDGTVEEVLPKNIKFYDKLGL